MLYHAYELTHAAISPMRAAAQMGQRALRNPLNPISMSYQARTLSAAFEMFVNATRRYGKPDFGIEAVEIDGKTHAVSGEVALSLPFCDLLHFRREGVARGTHPKVLIIAPMSGHFATLLRGTVEKMLIGHDVYVTDWTDARNVPLTEGRFDLDDYVDYLIEFCQLLGEDGERAAVLAVCQPGVPMLVAASMMAEDEDPCRPASITLMGSPIDTTRNPKQPNELATQRPLSWFEKNVVVTVPFPNMGFMRRVYPGFLQLSGFMAMNLDRHMDAHVNQFRHLIRGDGDSAASHRSFYDEYLAVMDLTADFYLQTIERVFQKHLLAEGKYVYRENRLIRPAAITDIALMTVEGEKDDITGLGQTQAALDLCSGLPENMKAHYEQEKVGHYGVFNGSRWRRHIQPRVADFIEAHRAEVGNAPAPSVKVTPIRAAE